MGAMGSKVSVVTIETTIDGPRVYCYATNIDTKSLSECCPIVKDQIQRPDSRSFPVPIERDMVVLPNLDKVAVKTLLAQVNRRANDKSLTFNFDDLYKPYKDLNPSRARNDGGTELAFAFYNAIHYLIEPSLTTHVLLRRIYGRLGEVSGDYLETKLAVVCTYASFDTPMIKYSIGKVLKLAAKEGRNGTTAYVMELCRSLGCGKEAEEVKESIEAKRDEDKGARVLAIVRAQLLKRKFEDNLAPAWGGKKK